MDDSFSTIAEVAVALAGFSGLFFAFQRRSGRSSSSVERFALSYLLGSSLSATVLALLPGVLEPFAAPRVTWIALPLLSGGVLLGLEAQLLRSGRFRFPWVRRVFAPLNWIVILLQFAGVFGFVKPEAAYGVALWWLVVHAAVQFLVQVLAGLRSHDP